jgi:hypothetical protein
MHAAFAPLVSGLPEAVSQLVVPAGTLLLLLMFVALGSFAYKQLRGDGIRWPDEEPEDPETADDSVTRGSDDDEWKYY